MPTRANKLNSIPKLQSSNNEFIRPGNFANSLNILPGIRWPSIYWGPDQYSIQDQNRDIYAPPESWKYKEFMRVPKVVRFIYDGYIHSYSQGGPDDPPPPPNQECLQWTSGGWEIFFAITCPPGSGSFEGHTYF